LDRFICSKTIGKGYAGMFKVANSFICAKSLDHYIEGASLTQQPSAPLSHEPVYLQVADTFELWKIMINTLQLIFLAVVWLSIIVSNHAQHTEPDITKAQEVDVSWDFNDNNDLLGWGNSTSEEMNMEVKCLNGELRCSIIGFSPKLESPRLFLNVSRRHFVIIRAKYLGAAQDARLLLRSGGAPSPRQNMDFGTSYWAERSPMVPLTSSAPSSASFDKALLADSDPSTFYLSAASTAINIVFDLQSFRWITAVRIAPVGDARSPKRCLLQQSMSTGVGPFETVRAFTMQGNSSDLGPTLEAQDQRFAGFNGYARYWRLIVLDNYGGEGIGIREVYLDGYDETVTPVPFTMNNTGQYHNYYLPINTYLSGTLLRMRLELVYRDASELNPHKSGKIFREALHIDHIRVARAPEVWKVVGCLDQYYQNGNYEAPQYNVTGYVNRVNNNLPVHYFAKNNMTQQYATTYDCPLEGGVVIMLEGLNFGMHPRVTIDNTECRLLSNRVWSIEGRVQQLTCMLPPGTSGLKRVRVESSVHPGK